MRLHLSTHLPLCLLQGQMARHTSQPRQKRERQEFNHTLQSTPPPPYPNPISQYLLPLHSSPTLPLSFSLILFFHLFKSLHFRCIHTFPISLCMSLPPSLPLLTSPCPSLPSSPIFSLSLSLCLPLPPIITSSYTSLLLPSFLLSLSSSLLPSLHPITVIHHSSISHHANRPPGYHSNHLRPGSAQPFSDWLAGPRQSQSVWEMW